MKQKILTGDMAFAGGWTLLGLYWVVGSLDFPLWSGFAPDSGFLPLVYGALLLLLSGGVMVSLLLADPDEEEREPLTKSMLVLGALVVVVASLGFIGFLLPVFAMMMFIYLYVERLPLLRSTIISALVTGCLALIFVHWLAVPLPLTPWDF
ncbi:tripartite tricarboxylate transporter TctB family protein [Ancylobacter sp. G4_0304]|uniref:tripartite tricarboxylate transporter TctB family protein n=1 Tax=Ancylobacter sp. G4_0304 TaxID=3114289 RepID=UPI0039C61789